MKALILNSGQGTRMGDETKHHPKCMTELGNEQTIISRQLKMLCDAGICDIVITTGPFEDNLIEYVNSLGLNVRVEFIKNPLYQSTNYIYSIYCAQDYLQEDILLLHGDLVFEKQVLNQVIKYNKSNVVIDSSLELPQKDFKAQIKNSSVAAIGIDYFDDDCVACQPMYYLEAIDWKNWLDKIVYFCENDNRNVYAENALNTILNTINLHPLDVDGKLCTEVDTLSDLQKIKSILHKAEVIGG